MSVASSPLRSTMRLLLCLAGLSIGISVSGCEEQSPLLVRRPDAPTQAIVSTWIANTYGGGDERWMPRTISGLFATPTGRVFLVGEDRRGEYAESRIVERGQIVGELEDLQCCQERIPGAAVVADDQYVFAAVRQKRPSNAGADDYPSDGDIWHAVRRYDHAGVPAPFAGGRGYDNSFLIVGTNTGRIAALALHGSGPAAELFVAHDTNDGRVTVYDADGLTEQRAFDVSGPRGLAIDAQAQLWIIDTNDGSEQPSVGRYDVNGLSLSTRIRTAENPTALAFDRAGRLFVADNGPRQQVLVFDDLDGTPTLAQTFGREGGLVGANAGDVRLDRLLGLSAVTVDASGNVYVGMNLAADSGARLMAFSANGAGLWELYGLGSYEGAAVDPRADGHELYTGRAHFQMDYQQPLGREARLVGVSLDWLNWPDDPRLWGHQYTAPAIAYVENRRFLFDISGWGFTRVFRFADNRETAIPAAVLGEGPAPLLPTELNPGGWLWQDKNGDGQPTANEYTKSNTAYGSWVNERGDIWRVAWFEGVQVFRVQGLDQYGVPIYPALPVVEPMPAPFERTQEVAHVVAGDVLYLTGYTAEHPNPYGDEAWTALGTEIVRYDDWSGARKIRWRHPLLSADAQGERAVGFAVAGDRVFVVYDSDNEIHVLDANTGAALGKFTPGPEIHQWLGVDRARMPLRAFRRANGEYLLTAADPVHAKVTLFRVPPQWPRL